MRIPFLFSVVLLCGALAAQVPQAFNYQAVARNASGDALAGQAIGIRLTLHSGTANGPVTYQEVHTTSTNALGLFTLSVGQGSAVQGSFAGVPWGSAAHFLQVELDATGGTNYTDIGTSQMLSVPYALHAGSMACPTVSLLGDTVRYGNGCYLIQPGMSAANGGCQDADQDGYYDRPGCNTLVDCDDHAEFINPGQIDGCGNGIDEDCNGIVDDYAEEIAWLDWHPDSDGDGFGNAAITITSCAQPADHVLNADDCDDADANIFPGQGCSLFCSPTEAAWVDQNQAFLYQQADALWLGCFSSQNPGSCLADQLAVSGLVPLGANCLQCLADRYNCITANCLAQCISGSAACQACIDAAGCDATFLQCMGVADSDGDGWTDGSDCGPNDPAVHPNATETCGDGIDSNCNGIQTEGEFPAWPDLDQDGFGSDEGMVMVCSLTGNLSAIDGDCDDSNPEIGPGFAERVDGLDNDCDGQLLPEEIDVDNDGYIAGSLNGDPWFGAPILGDNDCDDSDPNTHPGATEICNNIDDDCDGQVDEDGVCSCPPAGTPCNDGNACTTGETEDGACNCVGGSPTVCNDGNPCTIDSCDPLVGCIFAAAPFGTPCDDGNPNTTNDVCNGAGTCIGTPLQQEICDGIDNDGDGLTDAADPSLVLVLCENQTGVCNGVMKTADRCVGGTWLTCATSDYAIGSPVYEVTESSCDSQDNDCDGQVDEGCGR